MAEANKESCAGSLSADLETNPLERRESEEAAARERGRMMVREQTEREVAVRRAVWSIVLALVVIFSVRGCHSYLESARHERAREAQREQARQAQAQHRQADAQKKATEMQKIQAQKATVKPVSSHRADEDVTLDLGGGVKLTLVWIQPGTFYMGCPPSDVGRRDSEVQHKVTITKGFWLGKYEVTQEQWERVMGSKRSRFKGNNNPVECVSWSDCQRFISQLNKSVGGILAALNERGSGTVPTSTARFRLPTEAEWEYACRAGTTTRFYTGESDSDLDRAGWYGNRWGDATHHPVGQKAPNAWGLYDMHGNVSEWCSDWYAEYGTASVQDPTGPAGSDQGRGRVLRGGWYSCDARGCWSASRGYSQPDSGRGGGFASIGFRLALAAP